MSERTLTAGENDATMSTMIGSMLKAGVDAVTHKADALVEQYAQMYTRGARAPILHTPDEYGMEYGEC